MPTHETGTREQWLAARTALLADEKELTRRSDQLAQKRQALPWVAVEKDYCFETEAGTLTLADLFDGRSQLLVYHFMFGPTVDGWPDAGCVGCTYTADTLDGAAVHLPPRGVTFVAVSSAPLEKLLAYRHRMGWSFPWASQRGKRLQPRLLRVHGGGPEDRHGLQLRHAEARRRDRRAPGRTPRSERLRAQGGVVYHTYSCYDRGTDVLCATWQLLDRTPEGRGGDPEGWPRRHDEYERIAG